MKLIVASTDLFKVIFQNIKIFAKRYISSTEMLQSK